MICLRDQTGAGCFLAQRSGFGAHGRYAVGEAGREVVLCDDALALLRPNPLIGGGAGVGFNLALGLADGGVVFGLSGQAGMHTEVALRDLVAAAPGT